MSFIERARQSVEISGPHGEQPKRIVIEEFREGNHAISLIAAKTEGKTIVHSVYPVYDLGLDGKLELTGMGRTPIIEGAFRLGHEIGALNTAERKLKKQIK